MVVWLTALQAKPVFRARISTLTEAEFGIHGMLVKSPNETWGSLRPPQLPRQRYIQSNTSL
jgi:hypothetical protein